MGDSVAVVRTLLTYGRKLRREHHEPRLVPDDEANHLVTTTPFAFLLGVVFDEAVNAAWAWRAPLGLKQRLGLRRLEPGGVLAAGTKRVERAIRTKPALHMRIAKMTRATMEASRRVVEEFHGDAAGIWSGAPRAGDLQHKFDESWGVGQKKAAMAVRILAYQNLFGAKVRDLSGNDIAFDVQIRRTMLRTGLAERDNRQHMIDVARRLNRGHPGGIDHPLWRIGREWCRPTDPLCPECPIRVACPKLIDRAVAVRWA